MLMRTCGICGGAHPVGTRCPQAKERHQEYDRSARNEERAAFYKGRPWRALRAAVMQTSKGLDMYALAVEHRIASADVVHHIEPVEERPDLALVVENTIALSNRSHNRIHAEYEKSEENREKMKKLLKKIRTPGGIDGKFLL